MPLDTSLSTVSTRCGPARDHGKIGARPRALKDDDVVAARAMLKDLNIPVSGVARRLKVLADTPCKNFPGGRGGIRGGVTHG